MHKALEDFELMSCHSERSVQDSDQTGRSHFLPDLQRLELLLRARKSATSIITAARTFICNRPDQKGNQLNNVQLTADPTAIAAIARPVTIRRSTARIIVNIRSAPDQTAFHVGGIIWTGA
jgi:hypothetical protein